MDKDNTSKGERIAKVIARAGICSRREAEALIAEGKVKVNGKVLDTPACVVTSEDTIVVNGKPLPAQEKPRLFLYHKPVGLVTSHKDERGRDTVFSALPKSMPRVISVGRLDLNSEGLLLLTNDGMLSRYLELPSTGWTRRYRVRVFGALDKGRLEGLANGITIEGVRYRSIKVNVESEQGMNAWLGVTLQEGKNREIRRVMEALNLQVNRLIRVSYGPFNLDKIPAGQVEEVPERILHDQIKGYFKGAAVERGEEEKEQKTLRVKKSSPQVKVSRKPARKVEFKAEREGGQGGSGKPRKSSTKSFKSNVRKGGERKQAQEDSIDKKRGEHTSRDIKKKVAPKNAPQKKWGDAKGVGEKPTHKNKGGTEGGGSERKKGKGVQSKGKAFNGKSAGKQGDARHRRRES